VARVNNIAPHESHETTGPQQGLFPEKSSSVEPWWSAHKPCWCGPAPPVFLADRLGILI